MFTLVERRCVSFANFIFFSLLSPPLKSTNRCGAISNQFREVIESMCCRHDWSLRGQKFGKKLKNIWTNRKSLWFLIKSRKIDSNRTTKVCEIQHGKKDDEEEMKDGVLATSCYHTHKTFEWQFGPGAPRTTVGGDLKTRREMLK